MLRIKIRKAAKLIFMLLSFIVLILFASYIYRENSKISNTWNMVFPLLTPLEEPKEVLYKYSTRGGFHGDGIDINLMNVSNWNMKDVLESFPTKKSFTSYEEIKDYCKVNLYFSEEDSEILSGKLSDVFSEQSIWIETNSKENTEDILAIYYNPNNQKCLLIVSCL